MNTDPQHWLQVSAARNDQQLRAIWLPPYLDMATVQIDVGLILAVGPVGVLPRHHQGVEAHWALGPARVEVIHQHLQLPGHRVALGLI